MTLSSLIARLEAATGPDRELDAEIAVATFVTVSTDEDLVYAVLPHKHDACTPGCFWEKSRSGLSLRKAPAYTASLDSALTLVPEGWFLSYLGDDAAGTPPNMKPLGACCELENGITEVREGGPTRAIAVCIACLRARAGQ